MADFEIVSFPVGVLQCNCSVVFHPASKRTIVIDPGDESKKIVTAIQSQNFPVVALWHTHAHLDHIGATRELFENCVAWNEKLGAAAPKIYLYQDDLWLYKNVAIQASLTGLKSFEVLRPTDLLVKETAIEMPELISFKTPGHTPGSACLRVEGSCDVHAPEEFLLPAKKPKTLFTGDTLFRRSVGRTDLWGGSFPEIERSIRKSIYTLPDDYLVIPGHGAFTTIAEEIEKNAFVKGLEI